MKTTRNYVMRSRAESAELTRQRALHATVALAGEKPFSTIVLPEVAARAGVSVQTVLRQFGNRDGLLDAATAFVGDQLNSQAVTTPGNVRAALDALFDHFEARGDVIIMLLGQEGWDRRAQSLTSGEREAHREWVTSVFAPQLLQLIEDVFVLLCRPNFFTSPFQRTAPPAPCESITRSYP